MARPLRIEYEGALYHVTSRGNGYGDIYENDGDRALFVETVAHVVDRFNWRCHAYCLMSNHYHLLIETPDANLSSGMRQLNGLYTQRFNRTHDDVGHLFQGRFKAILVEKDSYLAELARYIVLNPVRAGLVRSAKDWRWSSYRSTAGLTTPPAWLSVEWVLSTFGSSKRRAMASYREFVAAGRHQPSPWEQLRHQIYLGSDRFVETVLRGVEHAESLSEVPGAQRRAPPESLKAYAKRHQDRNAAMRAAYESGGYTLKEIGDYFGLHYSSVSRLVREAE